MKESGRKVSEEMGIAGGKGKESWSTVGEKQQKKREQLEEKRGDARKGRREGVERIWRN